MTPIQKARARLFAELAVAEDMKAAAIVRTDDLRRLLDGPTEEDVARVLNPDLFSGDPHLEHQAASPFKVSIIKGHALANARAVLALFGRESCSPTTPSEGE